MIEIASFLGVFAGGFAGSTLMSYAFYSKYTKLPETLITTSMESASNIANKNPEKALHISQEVLKELKRRNNSKLYALAKTIEGDCYYEAAKKYQKEEYILKAVESYKNCLKIYSDSEELSEYAYIQNKLGNIYSILYQNNTNKESYIKKATASFEEDIKLSGYVSNNSSNFSSYDYVSNYRKKRLSTIKNSIAI